MKKTILIISILLVVFILTIVFIKPRNLNNVQPSSSQATSNACNADADCVIKDVHNCCGYYPRCVNKNFQPDIEAVRKSCDEEGVMSVCGYPSIDECRCIDNQCEGFQNGNDM